MRAKKLLPYKMKKNSLVVKMLIPMIVVLIIQSFIFITAMYVGQVFSNMDGEAVNLLDQKLSNRAQYFSNEYFTRWTNLSGSYNAVNSSAQQIIRRTGTSFSDIHEASVANEIFSAIDETIIDTIRNNSVTGAFVILRGTGASNRYGLYIRDDDPLLNTQDNSDLALEIAPYSYSSQMSGKITFSPSKDVVFRFADFTEDNPDFHYYSRPLAAADAAPQLALSDIRNLGYIGDPVCINGVKNHESITYTLPLVASGGEVYGVMGIQLELSYLRRFLPYGELGDNKEVAYLMFLSENGLQNINSAVYSGDYYNIFFENVSAWTDVTLAETYSPNSYLLRAKGAPNSVYVSREITVANSNTPFSNRVITIAAIVKEDSLFSFSTTSQNIVFIATAISIALCLSIIVVSVVMFTRPIRMITKQVSLANVNSELELSKTDIAEIDEFSDAVQRLNHMVVEAGLKTTRIIELADMPIAVFEIAVDPTNDYIFYTDRIFELFGSAHFASMSKRDFATFLLGFEDQKIRRGNSENIYHLPLPDGSQKWVSLKHSEYDGKILGVVSDVTQHFLERQKLEHERNCDILTDLPNRRAFFEAINSLSPEQFGTAMFVMLDLDNLKHVNDSYGHDSGDKYIVAFADVLKNFHAKNANSIVARMSGDEFYVLIFGCPSKEHALHELHEFEVACAASAIKLPDGNSFKLRASGGYAWYPDDTRDIEDLIKYADYAMYESKTETRGEIRPFDAVSYKNEAYLVKKREELNSLIDNKEITFHFQPIVDIRAGKIFGYEVLMRSLSPSFSSPTEILKAARAQFKLHKIEQLTIHNAMAAYVEHKSAFEGKKIFINSISNQSLSAGDIRSLEDSYGNLLQNVVLEFTESEQMKDIFAKEKLKCISRWDAEVALDDFGTGFNSESVLLSLNPHYAKIDMSIIRGVDADENRQIIVSNLVNIGRNLNIKIIAEGVETVSELKTVIALGVDYVQGFLLASPSPTPEPLQGDIETLLQTWGGGKPNRSK